MKALILRCLLITILGLLLLVTVLLLAITTPSPASAASPPDSANLAPESTFHLWKINEIFSCADGSIQFIEMLNSSNFEDELQGHNLTATNLGGTQTNQFIFNSDLSSETTQNQTILLATANFGSLTGGVTPDYIISSSFLFTQGGTLDFANGFDNFSYISGELPLDGVQSLNRNHTTGTNSPKNFAGTQGSIVCPGTVNADLAVTKKAPTTVISGNRIIYTLTVTSSGLTSNTNVILTDTIPSGTTFASAEVQPVNGVLTWTLGNLLPPSAVVSRTFAVTVNVPVGSNVINNNYGVRSDQISATGTPVTTTVVAPQAFLALSKKAPATVISGNWIIYTLTVTSSGSVPNTNVVLTDTIPASTTFASAEVQPVNGTLTWTLGTLNPLAVVSRTFAVTVNASAGTNVVNAKYGVRSAQSSANGLPVIVQIVGSQAIYLPIIFKNYPSLNEHDGVDSLYLPIGDN